MMKLNAKQLRKGKAGRGKSKVKKQDIYIILDNVLDTYNIGSIFRLADAVAAKKIYICGQSEIPPNHKIKKASINTTEWVDWEYDETAQEAIKKVRSLWDCHPKRREGSSHLMEDSSPLQERGKLLVARNDRTGMIVAIEQSKKSIPYNQFNYSLPICLIVGNESTGVSKEVLEMVDGIVELPMFGVNISLNVIVSLAIVLYKAMENS